MKHQLDHGQLDERFRRQDALLSVLAQAAALAQPGEAPTGTTGSKPSGNSRPRHEGPGRGVSSIGTENRRKSRKAGVPDRVMPNQQRPPALESALLQRLSEPLSPRRYLALITERQGHSGRSRRPHKPSEYVPTDSLRRFSVPLLLTSRGAADHQHHLRYTISQGSPALRWIAWRSSDPGGPPGGPQTFPPPYLA